MPKVIGLVSCSQVKGAAGPAQQVYTSRTFKARRTLVERTCDEWYILSGQYGLLDPLEHINVYESWIHTWPKANRLTWQQEVVHKLLPMQPDRVVIHAGKSYYDLWLEPELLRQGIEVEVPTRGLSNLQTFSALKGMLDA